MLFLVVLVKYCLMRYYTYVRTDFLIWRGCKMVEMTSSVRTSELFWTICVWNKTIIRIVGPCELESGLYLLILGHHLANKMNASWAFIKKLITVCTNIIMWLSKSLGKKQDLIRNFHRSTNNKILTSWDHLFAQKRFKEIPRKQVLYTEMYRCRDHLFALKQLALTLWS